MKVQCMVGIWLFIDALYLIFYNKRAKIISILAIAVVFLAIHNLKLRQYENAFLWNYYNTFLRTKQNYTRMPSNTPYANLILKSWGLDCHDFADATSRNDGTGAILDCFAKSTIRPCNDKFLNLPYFI